jgi:hypothetical protein
LADLYQGWIQPFGPFKFSLSLILRDVTFQLVGRVLAASRVRERLRQLIADSKGSRRAADFCRRLAKAAESLAC